MVGVTYVLLSIVIALVSVIAYFMYKNLTYWRDRGILYDDPHLFYGNVRGFLKTRIFHDIIYEHYKKFRNSGVPFSGFYFMSQPVAFIFDTKLAKNILIKDFSNFADRGQFYNERDDPLSAHLFNLDGVLWKRLRNKLSPTFTSGKMKYMFPTVVKVSNEFINVVGEHIKPGGSTLEVKELMACFTTDVIGTCAFGIECNSLRNPNTQFRIMGRKALTTFRHNKFLVGLIFANPKWARFLRLCITEKTVQGFFMDLVQQTVALRENEQKRRNDFMDMLIDMKNNKTLKLDDGEELTGLTLEEVSAQSFVFFLAGFETSSSTMSYALYELARNPDIQDKMRSEINETFAQHNQELTYESMKDLRYVDQVISETLRLYTIVPQLERKALRDYVVPDNPKYVIEAGTSVVIPACAYHRDPELYPEPEKFLPERFSPEMVAARDSVEWLPFGDGPRNCIGMRFGLMQARIGLAQLIKNFTFSVCSETEIPLKYDPKSFILGTLGGIHLKAERV